jgi:hypothetical protein
MVLAGAALVWVLRRLTPEQLRLLGSVSTALGVLSLMVFIGWDLTRWLATVSPNFARYSGQRILFAIGTSWDAPLVQVTLAGAICWIVGIVRKRRKDSAAASAGVANPVSVLVPEANGADCGPVRSS